MKSKKIITILAIETSCDDTGIAIVRVSPENNDFKVLSNVVSSQIKIHKKYGGVYPAMAKREHQKNLVPVLEKAIGKAGLLIQNSKIKNQNYNSKVKTLKEILTREPELLRRTLTFLEKYSRPDIDLIAVTNGPGLEPCLWTGINFAKALSYFWDVPIVSVNHIEAHILVNFINLKSKVKSQKSKLLAQGWSASGGKIQKLIFPAVCLVVSGGHTQLFLMKDFGKYEILGETRDDAAGECFDKTARILGLGYPGGPAIAELARQWKSQILPLRGIPRSGTNPKSQINSKPQIQNSKLPRPMISTKDYDFSFSGLKTAVLYLDQKAKIKDQKYKRTMAAEVQQAIIDVLIKKTIKATKDYRAKTIILGGGVAANEELRKQFIENCPAATGSRQRRDKLSRCDEIPPKAGRIENCNLLVPPKNLCTDNALMTAVAGYFRFKNGKTENWKDIKADANLRIE